MSIKSIKLAISKVGDLLLENKISLVAEGDGIDNITLAIPPYQRPYKWSAKNIIQLLDDILDAKNGNKEIYRVGTLILHYSDKYNIVDGQQRIISFSLLLEAVKRIYKERNIQVCPVNDIVFLKQSLAKNAYNVRNVSNNFSVVKRRLENFSDAECVDLLDYVSNHCEFIVVITDDLSEAFQFFDSQNARGKKLYPHDLLKAYHLREMSNIDVVETERIVKRWEDLDQQALSSLFSDYLYRLKEWITGNRADELSEKKHSKIQRNLSSG